MALVPGVKHRLRWLQTVSKPRDQLADRRCLVNRADDSYQRNHLYPLWG